MVVPFDTGDEVVVSLEYEKLANFCNHCSRLTHDMGSSPDLQKKVGSRSYEEYGDRRGVSRQQHITKQMYQGQEGGWEKPRKPAAKRALEFSGEESRGGFHNQMEALNWGQKKSFPGTWAESSEAKRNGIPKVGFSVTQHQAQSTGNARNAAGLAWLKPLYQPKSVSKETQVTLKDIGSPKIPELNEVQSALAMEDVPEMQVKNLKAGLQLSESNDDLLEDGEYQVGEDSDVQATNEDIIEEQGKESPTENKSVLKGNIQASNLFHADIEYVSQGMKGINLKSIKNQKSRDVNTLGSKGITGKDCWLRLCLLNLQMK
ncbi:predicted protein [Arabidopsis lyrata subsp. lyrata]|uniref:Predicted protein n=1 Tax=Arabidopsis lyrata subsp. lyrata TaxID=81972 RepID=D7M7K8_ARALL|nr:predicted protein [Arabidopsis lyrata subsp. lyrata]